MKIGFIEPHLKLFGGIRRIIEISNRLSDKGHDVTIYHPTGTPCTWMECKAKTKKHSEILAEYHDVIIFNDPNPLDYQLASAAHARLKLFYILELYQKELLKKSSIKILFPSKLRMRILKKIILSPCIKLSNATWEKEWLLANMGINSILLLGGVNSEVFYPIEKKNSKDITRILCSGDPRPRKGTKTIEEAFKLAKKDNPSISLHTYYGKNISQSDMAKVYSSADIFIEASWQAGWNNPAAEAMACKAPLICTDIGGVKDFALHEETALIVPSKNPQKMAEAINRLINNHSLRNKLKENAYKRIQNFSWDSTVNRLENIINLLI